MLFIAEENVQRGRDYIMKNKFELLEEPDVGGQQTYVDQDSHQLTTTRIFRTHVKTTHPVQVMVSMYQLLALFICSTMECVTVSDKPLGINMCSVQCTFLV